MTEDTCALVAVKHIGETNRVFWMRDEVPALTLNKAVALVAKGPRLSTALSDHTFQIDEDAAIGQDVKTVEILRQIKGVDAATERPLLLERESSVVDARVGRHQGDSGRGRDVCLLIDLVLAGAPVSLTPFNYNVGYSKGVELTTTYDNSGFHYYGNLAIGET